MKLILAAIFLLLYSVVRAQTGPCVCPGIHVSTRWPKSEEECQIPGQVTIRYRTDPTGRIDSFWLEKGTGKWHDREALRGFGHLLNAVNDCRSRCPASACDPEIRVFRISYITTQLQEVIDAIMLKLCNMFIHVSF